MQNFIFSKSIIKKQLVSIVDKQYTVHSGADKIFTDIFIQKEKERIENESIEENQEQNEFEEEITDEIEKQSNIVEEEIPTIDYSSILKQEYDKGFQDGKKSAVSLLESEYKKRISSTLSEFTNLIQSIKEEFEEYKKNIDKYIITLSIAIAEKIIKREVKIDNEIVIIQIKEAIAKILGVESITILINPKDEEIIRKFKDDILNKFDNLKEIVIQPNESIEEGSCKIESSLGNVDARFTSQLKIVEEALLENITTLKNNETN